MQGRVGAHVNSVRALFHWWQNLFGSSTAWQAETASQLHPPCPCPASCNCKVHIESIHVNPYSSLLSMQYKFIWWEMTLWELTSWEDTHERVASQKLMG